MVEKSNVIRIRKFVCWTKSTVSWLSICLRLLQTNELNADSAAAMTWLWPKFVCCSIGMRILEYSVKSWIIACGKSVNTERHFCYFSHWANGEWMLVLMDDIMCKQWTRQMNNERWLILRKTDTKYSHIHAHDTRMPERMTWKISTSNRFRWNCGKITINICDDDGDIIESNHTHSHTCYALCLRWRRWQWMDELIKTKHRYLPIVNEMGVPSLGRTKSVAIRDSMRFRTKWWTKWTAITLNCSQLPMIYYSTNSTIKA